MASERMRRFGKVGAIGGFGLVVFVVAFYVTLPYTRIKDWMASRVATMGYTLEVKHAGPSLGIGMVMKEVALSSRPTDSAKPTRILIDKATLGVSLLSYLAGTKSFSLAATVFGGELDANVKLKKDEVSARAAGMEIDLAELPWLKNATNLPASGKLDLRLELLVPKERLSEAKGSLSWECAGCAVGDGKAKLVIASNPLLAEGLGLPKIRLGDFVGKVPLDKGVGRLQGVQFKSQDAEATVEGEIHLAQPIAASHIDLYVRFKLSDSLLRSSEKLRTIMDFTAQLGKRPDGFIGFRISGPLSNVNNFQWLKTSPFVGGPSPAKPVPPARGVIPLPAVPVAPAPTSPTPAAQPVPVPPPPPPPAQEGTAGAPAADPSPPSPENEPR